MFLFLAAQVTTPYGPNIDAVGKFLAVLRWNNPSCDPPHFGPKAFDVSSGFHLEDQKMSQARTEAAAVHR